MEYKLLIDGQWVNAGSLMEVKNKYNGAVIAALPTARKEDVDAAIAAAITPTGRRVQNPK